MSTSSADRNPVERLAEEIAERYRHGERPSLSEYVEKYPQHADAIRKLFPVLVPMEQLEPGSEDGTVPYAGAEAGRPLERLWRWPVRQEADALAIGPPRLSLSVTDTDAEFDISQDGRTIAIADYDEAFVLPASGDRLPRTLRPLQNTRALRVSPDGRWVVTMGGDDHPADNKAWDARTGRLVGPVDAPGLFVRDGHWIANTQRRWETAGWKEVSPWPIPKGLTPLAASSDGRYLAFTGKDGIMHLVCAQGGHTLARLEPPEQCRAWFGTFSADGSQLIQLSHDDRAVQVWNLRVLRQHLTDLGLDWSAPPDPPAPEAPPRSGPAPLQVRISGVEATRDRRASAEQERAAALALLETNARDAKARYRLGNALVLLGQVEGAHKELSLALEGRPDHEPARLLRGQAAVWLRRWDEAFADADRLVKEGADYNGARYLRAEANHFRGQHAAAAADLTVLLARGPRRWSFLELRAACYAASGEKGRAGADWTAADALLKHIRPATLNSTAWRLVMGPTALRHPSRALTLIQEALRREPGNRAFQNTLGVACYRHGQYKEALSTLEKRVGSKEGQNAIDLFFLSMCHARLSDATRARDCFDRAVRLQNSQKGQPARQAEELAALRAEAEQTLRLP